MNDTSGFGSFLSEARQAQLALGSIRETLRQLEMCSSADLVSARSLLTEADRVLGRAFDKIVTGDENANVPAPTPGTRVFSDLTTGQALGMHCVFCGAAANAGNPTVPVGRGENGAQVFACAAHPNGLNGEMHSVYTQRTNTAEAALITEENFERVIAWVGASGTGYVPWVGVDALGCPAFSLTSHIVEGDEPTEESAPVGHFAVRYPNGRWRVYSPEAFNAKFELRTGQEN